MYIERKEGHIETLQEIKTLKKKIMMTNQEAIKFLVNSFKREIETDPELFHTQSRFDQYVADYIKYNDETQLTDEMLIECAGNAIEYDGFDYLVTS